MYQKDKESVIDIDSEDSDKMVSQENTGNYLKMNEPVKFKSKHIKIKKMEVISDLSESPPPEDDLPC